MGRPTPGAEGKMMIPNLTRVATESPIQKKPLPPGWSDQGLFEIDGYAISCCYYNGRRGLAVLLSLSTMDNGEQFIHCSLSRRSRLPSWDDVKIVKTTFLGEDTEAFHIVPKKEDYINVNPYCLHLWVPYGDMAGCADSFCMLKQEQTSFLGEIHTSSRTKDALLARRAVATKATPGQWKKKRRRFFAESEEVPYVVAGIAILFTMQNGERMADYNADFCVANNPSTVIADIDEILRLRAEVEQLKKDNEAHRVVTANFKRITENLANKIDDDHEVEEHIASLEAQIDFLAKTCARQSHDAPDEKAVNWWRAKAREAAEKKA